MALKAMVQNFPQVDFDLVAITEILDFLLFSLKLFQPIISIDLCCLPQGRNSSTLRKKYEVCYGCLLKSCCTENYFYFIFFPLKSLC